MRVRVLFFGVLRDAMGVPEREMEVAGGTTAGEMVAVCRGEGNAASVWESLAIAVNQEYAGREHVLREGDEIALLPPVSGGTGSGVRLRLASRLNSGCL